MCTHVPRSTCGGTCNVHYAYILFYNGVYSNVLCMVHVCVGARGEL